MGVRRVDVEARSAGSTLYRPRPDVPEPKGWAIYSAHGTDGERIAVFLSQREVAHLLRCAIDALVGESDAGKEGEKDGQEQ